MQIPSLNGYAAPNMPNYNLGPLDLIVCDTISTTIQLTDEKNQFDLFPNPAHNKVYFSSSKIISPTQFSIYNMMGILVKVNSSAINNGEYLEVDLSSIDPGIYFGVMVVDGERLLKKLVKE